MKSTKSRRFFPTLRTILAPLALAASCAFSLPLHADDAAEIRAVIANTYDRPDAKVVTDPVVSVGDHAIADWTQGTHGGRALLRRIEDRWSIVLCAGEELKSARHIEESGVPRDVAAGLGRLLADAERGVPGERRALFDSFGKVPRHDSTHH